MKLVVIGGSNIDYIGYSFKNIVMKDSNPGNITISFGGVARNIVENLISLDIEPIFITAIGTDPLGEKLESELKCRVIKPITNIPTSSYLAIHDETKDMIVSICDNKIIDLINQEFLKSVHDILEDTDFILLDANLNENAISYICNNYYHKKIIGEAVSGEKVIKFNKYLDKLYLLKANKLEYSKLNLTTTLKPNYLIVTNGKECVTMYHKNSKTYFEVPKLKDEEIVSTIGVGDAFISGVIYGLLNNLNIDSCIKLGIKASTVTLTSTSANSKDIKKIKFE